MNGQTQASRSQRSRRIAVVIPSFNHAQFIGEAIGSVLAQTHRDIELHVIDDGSTDGSPRVIEQALSAAPAGIHCEFTARGNRGCSATLNELIAGVRTEWGQTDDLSLYPLKNGGNQCTRKIHHLIRTNWLLQKFVMVRSTLSGPEN